MFLSSKKGLTIVELVIYATLLLLVMFIVVNVVFSITGSHRKIMLERLLEYNGVVLMDKLARDIRNADSVNLGLSVFNQNSGVLVLNSNNNGVNYSVKFDLLNGILRFFDENNQISNISSDSVSINSLIFNHFSNSNSDGVKIDIEIQADYGNESKKINISNFVVLRGSY